MKELLKQTGLVFGNRDGRKVISSVVEDFKNITKRLQEGVTLCVKKHEEYQAVITNANTHLTELNKSKEQAEKLIANITNLLS